MARDQIVSKFKMNICEDCLNLNCLECEGCDCPMGVHE